MIEITKAFGVITLTKQTGPNITSESKGRILKLTKGSKTNWKGHVDEHVNNVFLHEDKTNEILYLHLLQLLTENNFPAMQKTCLEHAMVITNCNKCNNRGPVSELDERLYDLIKNSARKIIQKDKDGKEVVKYQFDLINSGEKAISIPLK